MSYWTSLGSIYGAKKMFEYQDGTTSLDLNESVGLIPSPYNYSTTT
jgi:hypothetical protein